MCLRRAISAFISANSRACASAAGAGLAAAPPAPAAALDLASSSGSNSTTASAGRSAAAEPAANFSADAASAMVLRCHSRHCITRMTGPSVERALWSCVAMMGKILSANALISDMSAVERSPTCFASASALRHPSRLQQSENMGGCGAANTIIQLIAHCKTKAVSRDRQRNTGLREQLQERQPAQSHHVSRQNTHVLFRSRVIEELPNHEVQFLHHIEHGVKARVATASDRLSGTSSTVCSRSSCRDRD